MARQSVTDCCREMEGLLSLLSHSLRTLQEVELVDRHYARCGGVRVCVCVRVCELFNAGHFSGLLH